ncbi:phosphoenolpyruvate synthase [Nocardia sp. NPDC050175]|uniref:phosphoenolpyruvate synthase n=1 Tax=Nocardia sp. NPDC050175 TaxID=3364317 RepID=UPI0037918B72
MRFSKDQERAPQVSSIGGKARALWLLDRHGFAVPEWTVISGETFDSIAEQTGVRSEVETLRSSIAHLEPAEIAVGLRTVTEAFHSSLELRQVAADAYASVGSGRVAVRSSAAEEDGAQYSFAGQFESFLGVEGVSAVVTAIIDCWASAYSERVLAYRGQHQCAGTAAMAVIVQRMVDATASGVLFTRDPSAGRGEEFVISSVYGLGEGLVSGAVDADTVLVHRSTGKIVHRLIGAKERRFRVADSGGGVDTVSVETAARARLSITDDDIERLRSTGAAIVEAFGADQDIEWAFENDRLWILQSRAITTPVHKESVGAQRIWDNSNIIESYGDVCAPLTFTVAADLYGRMYREYARVLGVREPQLRQMDRWLPSMLGYFHGRVYYNLLHWYRMVWIAPGYRSSRAMLELSLGVSETLPAAQAESLRAFGFESRLRELLWRARASAIYLAKYATVSRACERFLKDFYERHSRYQAIDYDTMPVAQVFELWREFDNDEVEHAGPMLILDATLLSSAGLLYALGRRWLPQPPPWFDWVVISPGPDIESINPASALVELAAAVRADVVAAELLDQTPPEAFRQALRDAGKNTLIERIDAYLAAFGDRSPNELKLESPDLRDDPREFFTMLRQAPTTAYRASTDSADAFLNDHLHGFRRRIYELLRRKTQRGLAYRERLRFTRTRSFGLRKAMIRALGRGLAGESVLESDTDVFFLRLDEVRALFDGSASDVDLRSTVTARKRQRAEDEVLEAPPRFRTTGFPYRGDELTRAGFAAGSRGGSSGAGTVLRGVASGGGVAEGIAVVTSTPSDVDGGVLVTYRTDPGWVTALASASALIIERGSPLTHVAIVARELGVPTVVQIADVTKRLVTGTRVRVDGTGGTVTVLGVPADATADFALADGNSHDA